MSHSRERMGKPKVAQDDGDKPQITFGQLLLDTERALQNARDIVAPKIFKSEPRVTVPISKTNNRQKSVQLLNSNSVIRKTGSNKKVQQDGLLPVQVEELPPPYSGDLESESNMNGLFKGDDRFQNFTDNLMVMLEKCLQAMEDMQFHIKEQQKSIEFLHETSAEQKLQIAALKHELDETRTEVAAVKQVQISTADKHQNRQLHDGFTQTPPTDYQSFTECKKSRSVSTECTINGNQAIGDTPGEIGISASRGEIDLELLAQIEQVMRKAGHSSTQKLDHNSKARPEHVPTVTSSELQLANASYKTLPKRLTSLDGFEHETDEVDWLEKQLMALQNSTKNDKCVPKPVNVVVLGPPLQKDMSRV